MFTKNRCNRAMAANLNWGFAWCPFPITKPTENKLWVLRASRKTSAFRDVLYPNCIKPTEYWATISASMILIIISPFTSAASTLKFVLKLSPTEY